MKEEQFFVEESVPDNSATITKKYNIAVAGTGYVGLSIATLLAQHHHVTAVDIIPEKVDMLNQRKSPIQDEYIEKYLAFPKSEKTKRRVFANNGKITSLLRKSWGIGKKNRFGRIFIF